MSLITVKAQVEILRRIAERALKQAVEVAPEMIDVCQHMVDEAKRTEAYADKLNN